MIPVAHYFSEVTFPTYPHRWTESLAQAHGLATAASISLALNSTVPSSSSPDNCYTDHTSRHFPTVTHSLLELSSTSVRLILTNQSIHLLFWLEQNKLVLTHLSWKPPTNLFNLFHFFSLLCLSGWGQEHLQGQACWWPSISHAHLPLLSLPLLFVFVPCFTQVSNLSLRKLLFWIWRHLDVLMDQYEAWTIIRQIGNSIPAGDTFLYKPLVAATVTLFLTKQSLCFLPGGAIIQSVKKEM